MQNCVFNLFKNIFVPFNLCIVSNVFDIANSKAKCQPLQCIT